MKAMHWFSAAFVSGFIAACFAHFMSHSEPFVILFLLTSIVCMFPMIIMAIES